MKPTIGIIGGSGLYELDKIKSFKWKKVITPFGKPSAEILETTLNNIKVLFLPRHGKNHTIPPHKINYKANIYAMKKLGATDIISISAVGSLKNKHKPGDFVLVNQFIDRTFNRATTFFDEGCVVHVSLANPVSNQLIKTIIKSASRGMRVKKNGTYVAIEGPQFSTYAESLLYKSWNCDVIGMTNLPEIRLAREAELGYATIAMVTDYDCWHKNHDAVTVNQIIQTMNKNTKNVKDLLKSIFNNLNDTKSWNWKDSTYTCLNEAVITQKKNISNKILKKLQPILKRRFLL